VGLYGQEGKGVLDIAASWTLPLNPEVFTKQIQEPVILGREVITLLKEVFVSGGTSVDPFKPKPRNRTFYL